MISAFQSPTDSVRHYLKYLTSSLSPTAPMDTSVPHCPAHVIGARNGLWQAHVYRLTSRELSHRSFSLAPHRNASPRIASPRLASHRIASHRTASPRRVTYTHTHTHTHTHAHTHTRQNRGANREVFMLNLAPTSKTMSVFANGNAFDLVVVS